MLIVYAYLIWLGFGIVLALLAISPLYRGKLIIYRFAPAVIVDSCFSNYMSGIILFSKDKETLKHELGHLTQLLIWLPLHIAFYQYVDTVWINVILLYPIFVILNYVLYTFYGGVRKALNKDYEIDYSKLWIERIGVLK